MFLPTFEQACNAVRYKIDYYLIDARQRYYSNSRNPRVIQTKLQNQTLMSLRTCPHDKYLLNPGEFLTLGRKEDEDNDLNSFVDLYNGKSEGEGTEVNETQIYETPIGKETQMENEAQIEDEAQNENTKLVDLDQCSCDCHGSHIQTSPQTLVSRASRLKRRFKRKSPEPKPFMAEPTIVEQLATADFQPEPLEHKTAAEISLKILGRFPFTGTKAPQAQSCRCAKCVDEKKVWRTVLNDVSLSAARLSTGSDGPTSREDYENLSCDFIESKKKNSDVFAENLQAGKARFHGKPVGTTIGVDIDED